MLVTLVNLLLQKSNSKHATDLADAKQKQPNQIKTWNTAAFCWNIANTKRSGSQPIYGRGPTSDLKMLPASNFGKLKTKEKRSEPSRPIR